MLKGSSHILTTVLLMVLCLSVIVWPVDHHYCRGNLRSVNFFGKAPSCHAIAKKSCCSKGKKVKVCFADSNGDCKKGCCENEMKLIDFEEDMTMVWSELPSPRSAAVIKTGLAQMVTLYKSAIYLDAKIPDKKPPDRSELQIWRL